ncbi:MAG: 3-hexulose-6-phosphate synthase [Elusimicrobiota bacterium]|nr:orotidine 5'-phosphate decarboxylase [Endomicrobiia bacterium]MDW8055596.1 3-hexulose-6-phosphate synthase [Elusimicrobiota bacterium]
MKKINFVKKPLLQVALDFVDLHRAVKTVKEIIDAGVDIIEVGTPLIKSEGVRAISEIKKLLSPNIKIVADMKTMDVGRIEVEMAAKAGAHIVGILGVADDETIKEAIEAAKNYGCEIIVDMIEVKDVISRVKEVLRFGPSYIGLHIPIDEQMKGSIKFDVVREVKKICPLPVSIAGGINSDNVVDAVEAGADIIVVGGAIIKSQDAKVATQQIKTAMLKKMRIKTELYKRIKDIDEVRNVLKKVSTANISDALHRGRCIDEVKPLVEGIKLVGPAVTVRTYPGDWSKPVEAIDLATEGDVVVIDAGGVPPAVWGELATYSAIGKKLAGVVVWGAIRDIVEIKKLKFPAFSKTVSPQAGEPKGFGEINIPINIAGIKIFPGDWIVGDDDGVVVIPKDKLIEVTNRAMDVLEKENRIRKEIQDGSTLSKVQDLLRWEKK